MPRPLRGWRARLRRRLLYRLRPGRTDAELHALLGRAEIIQSDEHRRMLENFVGLSSLRVREVMVPRSDIRAVEIGAPTAEAERVLAEHRVNRLPVIENDLDHVHGIVHARDLFTARVRGEQARLANLLRPCLRVPEQQLALGLLTNMRRKGIHIAIVLDEYGGTAGLVTLSDLLSEILGPLEEGVEAGGEEECVPHPGGGYVVQGRMHIEGLEAVLGQRLPHGDFDTVAGMLINELGRIPVKGERLEVAGLVVHVQEADPRRIIQVLVEPEDA